VFSGEAFRLEDEGHRGAYQYSLSPIHEGDKVIGASIFAENITKRKEHDRALVEANQKIEELKLMALRSVMSPHFIFNVLNSIQFFIARNDRLNAINYLSTFSKLIRSILNQSVSNRIKLAEEVDMLKNYVHLEMTRFEAKFNFVLDVEDSVDLETIEIPSLLVQPYVENAILHGLYNKRSPGTLTVRVKEGVGSVVFEIEDDGVGRAEAMRVRAQNFPSHKSMGIRLTEERLKLIKQQNNAALEIEDLEDENGEPSGTKVRISIPY
jgi:LytS/YehU family sensor histidine kinase